MKKEMFWKLGLGFVLAALPFAGGCDQQTAESAQIAMSPTNDGSVADLADSTNTPPPDVVQSDLETAPGQLVSSAGAPEVSGPSADVAKLAQAGVDESVMLSYVTNSPRIFNLSADDIVYLNDIGVPGTVVTAMIQHDQTVQGTGGESTAPAGQPVYSNQGVPEQAESGANSVAETAAAPPVVEAPLTPPEGNVSYNYFYSTLAPYGNWVNIEGYGLCWQPTVTVVNRGWQPYSDNGYWVYSDAGWYWASDYSWGWAPFHYGRWFRHRDWGWCWAPDTVWGPAWVSWRYSGDYCGWAPLPPTACYVPGIGFTYFGRSVGFDFSFGLNVNCFSFVSIGHFNDRHWHRHRMPDHEVRGIFNHTVIANRIVQRNKIIVNEGIPVTRVAAATHSQITRHRIRDAADPRSARFERGRDNDRSLAVYRPNLPPPSRKSNFVGQGVKLDARAAQRVNAADRISRSPSPRVEGSPKSPFDSRAWANREQRPERTPAADNRRAVLPRNDARDVNAVRNNSAGAAPRTEKPGSVILRGSDRTRGTDTKQNPPNSIILRGNRDGGNRGDIRPSPPAQPAQPRVAPQPNGVENRNRNFRQERTVPQPTPPAQDNRNRDNSPGMRIQNRQSYNVPARQPQAPVVTAPLTPPARQPDQNRIDRQSERTFRQEQPRFSQPAPRPQWQPPVRSYQPPPMQPREQPTWNTRQGNDGMPSMRSQPSPPPRMESRPAPAPSAPAGQQNGGGGGGGRNDRNNGGGHRNR